jgi:hypothetical protein
MFEVQLNSLKFGNITCLNESQFVN